MSALTKNVKPLFLGIVAIALLAGCKKDADIPKEVRPRDFWVKATVSDSSGQDRPFVYRGEDQITIDSFIGSFPYTFEITYNSVYGIAPNQTKYITSALIDSWGLSLFKLSLMHPDLVEDPLLPAEWTREELEEVLVPGTVFKLGNDPGQALVTMRYFDDLVFHNTYPVNRGTVTLLEVEEYGSPDAGIPYFGKKARFLFSGEFYSDNDLWQVSNGEAVLFFRYFNY